MLPITLLLVSSQPMQGFSHEDMANKPSLAMIFLKDNILLERDLTFDDIKPRLLGGCPAGYLFSFLMANSLHKVTGELAQV